MRIVLAYRFQPFRNSPDVQLATWLQRCLTAQGHRVEEVLLPWSEQPSAALEQIMSCRLLDITHAADKLIALGSPGHLLRHPKKVVWLAGTQAATGELRNESRESQSTAQDRVLRQHIAMADKQALVEAEAVFCGSTSLVRRLQQVLGVSAEHLAVPSLNVAAEGSQHFPSHLASLLETGNQLGNATTVEATWAHVLGRLAA